MTGKSPYVVSHEWLLSRVGKPGLTVIDGSWYLPAHNRDARAEYRASHIPGAVFFDHDEIVEPETGLPHSLPSPAIFAQHAGDMGIRRGDPIIVYDGPGFFSAPRVWWMFRIMGAENVFVLDGGFDRWKDDGHPVTGDPTNAAATNFVSEFDPSRAVKLDEMQAIVESGSLQVADARPPGRFSGSEPEPRAGMRSGHMPDACNVPALGLSKDGYLLPVEELRRKLLESGIDLDKPVVTTCGSGVTAATITLALHSLGHTDNRLYDGSWSEWGGLDDTPVVTGD